MSYTLKFFIRCSRPIYVYSCSTPSISSRHFPVLQIPHPVFWWSVIFHSCKVTHPSAWWGFANASDKQRI